MNSNSNNNIISTPCLHVSRSQVSSLNMKTNFFFDLDLDFVCKQILRFKSFGHDLISLR